MMAGMPRPTTLLIFLHRNPHEHSSSWLDRLAKIRAPAAHTPEPFEGRYGLNAIHLRY